MNPARARFDLGLWKKVRKLAGIEDVRLHDLRHTFASQAAMQGIPLPVVARLLGHAQVQMTLRYAHVSDRDVEAAAERIGGVMAGFSKTLLQTRASIGYTNEYERSRFTHQSAARSPRPLSASLPRAGQARRTSPSRVHADLC